MQRSLEAVQKAAIARTGARARAAGADAEGGGGGSGGPAGRAAGAGGAGDAARQEADELEALLREQLEERLKAQVGAPFNPISLMHLVP